MQSVAKVELTELICTMYNSNRCYFTEYYHYLCGPKCGKCDPNIFEKIENVFSILSTKTPSDFRFDDSWDKTQPKTIEIYQAHELENNYDAFLRANVYHFDDKTLDWVGDVLEVVELKFIGQLPLGLTNKSIQNIHAVIVLLIDAGIVECSNGNETDRKFNSGSHFLYKRLSRASDEELMKYICWGLKPGYLSYREYGCRQDKTFRDKMRMFNVFYDQCKLGLVGRGFIDDADSFSDDIEEIKKYILWAIERGAPKEASVWNTCSTFGPDLIKFLYDLGVPIDYCDSFLCYDYITTEKKIECMEAVSKYYPINRCFSPWIMADLLEHQNYDIRLYQYLFEHGAPTNHIFIDRMCLDHIGRSEYENMTYDFVVSCLTMVFKKGYFPIANRDEWVGSYLMPDSYRFEGKLYEWMIEQPVFKKWLDKVTEIRHREKEKKEKEAEEKKQKDRQIELERRLNSDYYHFYDDSDEFDEDDYGRGNSDD